MMAPCIVFLAGGFADHSMSTQSGYLISWTGSLVNGQSKSMAEGLDRTGGSDLRDDCVPDRAKHTQRHNGPSSWQAATDKECICFYYSLEGGGSHPYAKETMTMPFNAPIALLMLLLWIPWRRKQRA